MSLKPEVYKACVDILNTELMPALGCTEPIAIAYAAAKAKETLGCLPETILVEASGNIVKNVKGVIVPTTIDLRGMSAAAIIGTVGGDASLQLEVLKNVNADHLAKAREMLAAGVCKEQLLITPAKLHIIITMTAGADTVRVELLHEHANIVRVERNGEVLLDIPTEKEVGEGDDHGTHHLTVAGIVEFANEVNLDDVRGALENQIACNTAISKEGLTNNYGTRVGQVLMSAYDSSDVSIRAAAAAAAGSDARMSGCEMPVVICCGSGNQGMTISLPILEYAKELGSSEDKVLRALCIANLIAVRIKSKMGRLSAFCGAVSAGTGAACGVAYLQDCGVDVISGVITNTLGNVGGIVCDGAKPSCAAKIASSIHAGLLGLQMAKAGLVFQSGEGLVKDNIEATIDSVAKMAKEGMSTTDEEILKIMVEM